MRIPLRNMLGGHMPHFMRHNTRRLGKTRQRRDVPAGVVIDDLEAIPSRMGDEDAAALAIERAVIERRVSCIRYFNDPSGGPSHGCYVLAPPVKLLGALDRALQSSTESTS